MQELFSFYCLYLPNKGSMQIDNITGHLKADAINVKSCHKHEPFVMGRRRLGSAE